MNFELENLKFILKILENVDNQHPKNSNVETSNNKKFYQFSLKMKWITSKNNLLNLTERGEEILNAKTPTYLRIMIKDYIQIEKPFWARFLSDGPISNKNDLPGSIYSIFEAAELMGRDFDKMEWIDSFVTVDYDEINALKVEIGREGEKLILRDEYKRTGKKAEYWGDISKLGYDIKSTRKIKNVSNDIFIEVKAGKRELKNIKFHLSFNQWNTSQSHLNNYFIFIVSIIEKKYFQLTPKLLKKYITDFPQEKIVNWGEIEVNLKLLMNDLKSQGINLDNNIIQLL